MRAFCTVSAPLEVCAPPSRPLPPGTRFLALKLLGTPQPRTLYFLVEAKSRVREVYAQTCHHFSKQGMLDTELFGLAVLIDGEYLFADPESKLSKYGPKSWRSSHTHGLDANGKPLLELHFRVQFYIESPLMLRDEVSRHNYYLQLKYNAINRDLPKECSEQSLLLLGGLSLQADLGDSHEENGSGNGTTSGSSSSSSVVGSTVSTTNNNSNANNGVCTSSSSSNSTSTTTTTTNINTNNSTNSNTNSANNTSNSGNDYFRPDEYVNPALRSVWGISALTSCHRENRGMSRADAETHYIREACNLNEAINAHVFRMKQSKNETGLGSVSLSIHAKGIKIAVDNSTTTTFNWPSIGKLSFDRKKFEIRSGENKITLYSVNDDKNKMILALCRETHQFSMKIAPRLTEAIKREEEESSCIHGYPYLYSRALNLPYKSKSDQRISVISSTSSNTTSGIVSDRVHSEDELEIMINTPPTATLAAPSTESLALVHLLDCPSVSRQTSSVGQVSMKDLEGTLAALSVRSNTIHSVGSDSTEPKDRSVKDCESSPSSQHNIGSQCSSTCSTVVVATDCINLPQTSATGSMERRQTSTCSSLELGYSHTAQNSTLSVATSTCLDHDINEEEEEANSGVYTLAHVPPTETSGVYTMNSSEMTGQSSEIAESESHESSHYGSFHPCQSEIAEPLDPVDSVDGDFRPRLDSDINDFRMRSDSNVSAAGSFRGDGSDPTDNKHTLLSAEELTDLIVGRGTYPSRKTVSHTLDSDCDYVTLPLPLEGESYLQGSEDTAPTEDEYDDDVLPPAPPKRIDSNMPMQRQAHISMISANDSPPPPPPPYNAHHETTGLRGPDIRPDEAPVIPLRDPPPYPQKPTGLVRERQIPPPAIPSTITSTLQASPIPEEVPARFITTRPHINILKAHTSIVGETPKPSYAAPTVNNITNLSQSPIPVSVPPTSASGIGIPVVPYHKSITSPPPPYMEIPKPPHRACVLLPVIKPRQYHPPPPPTMPRQPPPPPPAHSLATVYTGQLARSQIELYQQQLYSDVDYVIYPIQDPSISQQEYLDAKQGSILAAMAQSPPPPSYLAYHTVRAHNRSWDACKNHAIYRSTPYLSMALSSNSRYASTQNLSDTYVQLPGAYSPLYSPSVASLCSSYEPPPPPPLRPRPISNSSSSMFVRSRSDDNILNSVESTPKIRRLPPPPPPPYEARKAIRKPPIPLPTPEKQIPVSVKSQLLTTEKPPEVPAKPTPPKPSGPSAKLQAQIKKQYPDFDFSTLSTNTAIDIKTLREKSKNLDLPLISALMHDRSLLKQTRAFVMPKHPKSATTNPTNSISATNSPSQPNAIIHKSKYPVSGLSTTQLTKPRKSSVVSHRHPNDKLPPLPGQTATEGNNYVMDPTPAKPKSYNSSSQPSA